MTRRVIRSDAELRMLQLRGQVMPVITTMTGSATALLPVIPDVPMLPPFGLMMLLGWRLLRPELWPVWIGLPLGLIDDLLSGQPVGSAALLWTVILLMLDQLDRRTPFRDVWQDWLSATLAIGFALAGGLIVADFVGGGNADPRVILAQLAISIVLFPLVMRVTAALDRWRLR